MEGRGSEKENGDMNFTPTAGGRGGVVVSKIKPFLAVNLF
jgi:hypothetical protein